MDDSFFVSAPGIVHFEIRVAIQVQQRVLHSFTYAFNGPTLKWFFRPGREKAVLFQTLRQPTEEETFTSKSFVRVNFNQRTTLPTAEFMEPTMAGGYNLLNGCIT
jgi:hypothetical protein